MWFVVMCFYILFAVSWFLCFLNGKPFHCFRRLGGEPKPCNNLFTCRCLLTKRDDLPLCPRPGQRTKAFLFSRKHSHRSQMACCLAQRGMLIRTSFFLLLDECVATMPFCKLETSDDPVDLVGLDPDHLLEMKRGSCQASRPDRPSSKHRRSVRTLCTLAVKRVYDPV